jgi:RHS repeat-associated protein
MSRRHARALLALALLLPCAAPSARALQEASDTGERCVRRDLDPRPLLPPGALAGPATGWGEGDEAGTLGLGVDTGTGAFAWDVLEAWQPGLAGLDLRVERFHLSSSAYDGPLGWNWDSPLFMRIADYGPGTAATLHDGRFNSGVFAWAGTSGGVSTYATPNAWFLALTRSGGGPAATYVAVAPQGETFRFEYDLQQSGRTWYRLKELTDPNGNRITWAYSPNGLLASVTDTVGNAAKFAWILSGPNAGRLKSVTLPGGAVLGFTYDAAGNQVQVSRPAPDGAPGTSVELLTYDAAHRVVSITNPGDAAPWLVNAYDAVGRVVSQQQGAPGQTSTWNWSTWPVVSRTDRLGQVTDFTVDPATGLVLAQSVRDMGSPGSSWTTTFQYDAHRHLVREVKPDGRAFEWAFETSSDPRRRNNLLRTTAKSSAGATGGLVRTWGYTPDFNKLAWEMSPRANAQTGNVYDPSRATVMAFDAKGNMTSATFPVVATPAGPQVAVLQWAWDGAGRVTRFTDARGTATDMAYDDSVLPRPFPTAVVADPAGVAAARSFTYDAVNLMTSASGACACSGGSSRTDFAYDAARRLRQVTVHLDAATRRETWYDHDAQGRLLAVRVQDDSTVGDGWAVTGFTWDALGNLLAVTEDLDASRAAVSSWIWDAEERLLEAWSPAGRGVRFTHDERGLLVEARRLGDASTPADDVVTALQHDAAGRLARVDRPDGTFEACAYDAWGRLAAVTDGLGRVTSWTHDEDDRLLVEELHSATGQLLDRWNMAWDERGRLSAVERLAVDAAGQPLGGGDGFLTLSVERDAGGLVLARHHEHGGTTTHAYDALGRLVSTRDGLAPASGHDVDWHPDGRPHRLWAVEGDPASGLSPRRLLAEWASYDGEGRPLQVMDATGAARTWSWTLRGDVRRIVTRSGGRADLAWDEARRLLSHERPLDPQNDPAQKVLRNEYGWDDDGLLVAATVWSDSFGPAQSTLLARDAFGLLDAVTWPDGSQDDYQYDTALRLVRHADPQGNVVDSSYDAAGRLSDRQVAHGPGTAGTTQEHFEYDLLDRLVLAANDDYEVTRAYGSLGAMERETIKDLLSGAARTSRAAYDAAGRLARLEYPAHTAAVPDALLLGWDTADRLTSLVKQEGAAQRTVAQFEWMGERLLRRWNPTLETRATWDALGRPASIEHRLASGTPLARFDLRHGPEDELLGVLRTFFDASGQPLPDGASGGLAGGLVNVFDAVRRLVESSGGVPAAAWGAGSSAGALLRQVFDLDRNENRVTTSENTGGPLWQLTAWVVNVVNQYVKVGGQPAGYDKGGNLLSMPGGPTVLAYDFRDHPLAWTAGGVTDSARYDALGRRIETAGAQRAEVLTWFDELALEQAVAGPLPAPLREFVYGDGFDDTLEVRDVAANAAYPMLTDNLGSPVALLAPGGAVLESYRYSVWGRRTAASPATGALLPGPSSALGNPVTWAGRWTMNGSDQVLDFRARAYLPDWGRFAQPDPLGYPDGRLNRYQFSGNNPWRKDNRGLHDDGHPTDPPGVNTHVGITKQSGIDVKFDPADTELSAFWNWYQDNGPNVASLKNPWCPNHFNYHALGRTQKEQEDRLRQLMDAATGGTTDECNMRSFGEALHYAQDMVAHRKLDGSIYGEKLGHALDTALRFNQDFGFDPDGPSDATGNELVERQWGSTSSEASDWQVHIIKVKRNPHGYERHKRKLKSIANSGDLMKEFMQKCGPGTGQAYWPRYQGGKPKPATTGGKTGPKTGGKTEGPKTGPTTPGGSTKAPDCTGPTTPGPNGPSTPGPSGPTTPGPTGPSTPGPSGPTTPGPSGPATPLGPSTPGPQGPTTPGPTTPGPGTGPTTGPKKPKGPITPGGEWPTTPGTPSTPGGGGKADGTSKS